VNAISINYNNETGNSTIATRKYRTIMFNNQFGLQLVIVIFVQHNYSQDKIALQLIIECTLIFLLSD
jgi:hypothetical protein